MILSVTGHRPPKLGGYTYQAQTQLTTFARLTLEAIRPDSVITGMALGWDSAIAYASFMVGIPFTAAIPFVEQPNAWPERSRNDYQMLLSKAAHVEFVCAPGYAPWKLQKRNEWMVDHSTHLGALWNGEQQGGTANCLVYAVSVSRPTIHLWQAWQSFRETGIYPKLIF